MNNFPEAENNSSSSWQQSQQHLSQVLQTQQQEITIQDNQSKILNDLSREVDIPIDQFKILVESVKINKKFLLLTLNPKGRYFQNLRRLLILLMGLLTLQFYQLLYLFTPDITVNSDLNEDHKKFILQNHNDQHTSKKAVESNFYFDEDIDSLLPVEIVRTAYIIASYLGFYFIKKVSLRFSNRNLLIAFLSIISATYAIQWYYCHLYPNYQSLHFEDIHKHNKMQIYLDTIIFLTCYLLQGVFSISILYLINQQANFMLRHSQKDIFYNECLLIYSEVIVISSCLHMFLKEQFIFNLIIMWIPFLLVTLYVALKIYDSPINIITRIRQLEIISIKEQQMIKKQQIAGNKITNLVQELHQTLHQIYITNYPSKEYYNEDKVKILLSKFQQKQLDKMNSSGSINFIIFTLSLLYFGHLFKLNFFVNSLNWNLETFTLIISVCELVGYFMSNYLISELYHDLLLQKLLMIFGILTFSSAIPYFSQIGNNQFQTQIVLCSILIIRLQFWLAMKAFLITIQDYKFNYICFALGLIFSFLLTFQLQVYNLILASILMIASNLAKQF